jgi:hypothetical protein
LIVHENDLLERIRGLGSSNIHFFFEQSSTDSVIVAAEQAARKSGHHIALLQGEQITSIREALFQLAVNYDFPKYAGDLYEGLSLDGANDWLGDLSWLSDKEEAPKGYLLIYRSPLTFLRSDLANFIMFLDLIGLAVQYHQQQGTPFHIVVGPLSIDVWPLLTCLRIVEHYSDTFIE